MKLPSSSSAKKGAQGQQAASVSKLRGKLGASDNGLRLVPEDAEDVRTRLAPVFVGSWSAGRRLAVGWSSARGRLPCSLDRLPN